MHMHFRIKFCLPESLNGMQVNEAAGLISYITFCSTAGAMPDCLLELKLDSKAH
jgi:hypothetical protein